MRSAGYTLIELLVVISIIGILSVVAFVNIKDFSSSQALKKAAGDVHSFLRLAQSNATSAALCGSSPGDINWTVTFNTNSVVITCRSTGNPYKALTLQTGITIGSSCSLPFSVYYSALRGVPNLSNASCWVNGNLTITLDNGKGETKKVILTNGGAVNVE